MHDYTRTLATFSSRVSFDELPPPVSRLTKLAVLDCLGNIVAASRLDFADRLMRYTKKLAEREEASVFGCGIKTSARTAAFVNGSLAETIEMQDGYTKGGGHACCGTIPTALALAQRSGSSGKNVLAAVVAGYEVGNRVAQSMHTSHLSLGFQPTGTAGTVGAAAAAARMMNLDAEQTMNALGIAGFILPVSTGDNLWGGYSVKPVHGGEAGKVGIECAMLAAEGLLAAPLEGDADVKKGLCRVLSEGEPKFAQSVADLGSRYTVEEVYFKPYASCRMNHVPIEVAIGLRTRHEITESDIESITVRTYAFAKELVGSVSVTDSTNLTRAQFSMSFAIAMALVHGAVGVHQLTPASLADRRVHDLAARVEIIVDPGMQALYPKFRPTEIEVLLKNGVSFRASADYAKGDYRNPMSESELISKFIGLASDVIGSEKAQRTASMVMELDALRTLDELLLNLCDT